MPAPGTLPLALGLARGSVAADWALVLSAATVALGLALIALAGWRRRATRKAFAATRPVPRLSALRTAGDAMVCPGCGERCAAGARFCPLDARRLIPVAAHAGAVAADRLRCPRCRRVYDPGDAPHRFCPFDAEELEGAVPTDGGEPTAPDLARAHAAHHGHGAPGGAKICPLCASKYTLETAFCGRDGSELMPVN